MRVKIIDHSSAMAEIGNPIAKYVRGLRDHALGPDTETTGVSTADEVIELGIVRASDGSVIYEQQFKPSKRIEYHSKMIHRIEDYQLEGAPLFTDRYQEVCSLLDGKTVLA